MSFRSVEHDLIVQVEIFEERGGYRRGFFIFHLVKNLGNCATPVDRVIDSLLARVDEQKEFVEEMRLVQ